MAESSLFRVGGVIAVFTGHVCIPALFGTGGSLCLVVYLCVTACLNDLSCGGRFGLCFCILVNLFTYGAGIVFVIAVSGTGSSLCGGLNERVPERIARYGSLDLVLAICICKDGVTSGTLEAICDTGLGAGGLGACHTYNLMTEGSNSYGSFNSVLTFNVREDLIAAVAGEVGLLASLCTSCVNLLNNGQVVSVASNEARKEVADDITGCSKDCYTCDNHHKKDSPQDFLELFHVFLLNPFVIVIYFLRHPPYSNYKKVLSFPPRHDVGENKHWSKI